MSSNDVTFCPALCNAYVRRHVHLAAGIGNLMLMLGGYDVVHFHWPEELVGFRSASDPAKTEAILRVIDWWRDRALLVATVHNLLPHSAQRLDGPEARFYAEFYRRMDVIGHFSNYSRQRFAEVYSAVEPARQSVHGLNTFEHLRPLARGRAAARAALGLPQDKKVFAVIGAIRDEQEATLIEKAWIAANVPDSLLLAATRPGRRIFGGSRAIARLLYSLRFRGKPVVHLKAPLADQTLVQVVEAVDAIIIPRFGNHLNSGILPLALTFGTPIIAPDFGIFRETINTPANELYEQLDADALARAIRSQAAKDNSAAVQANLAIAASLGWDAILEKMWPVMEIARATRQPCLAQ